MNLYATPQELAAFLDPDTENPPVPPLATVRIRHASTLVDRYVTEGYRTGTDGLPTDTKVATALKDATLQQASEWSLHGIDPRIGASGAPRRVASKGLNGASKSYVADSAADLALSQLWAADTLSSAAYAILVNAGLVSNRVVTGGGLPETFRVAQRYYDPTTGVLE